MKFKKIKHLHMVGIGGVGMSGIAEVLLNLGYKVSGSDLKASDTTAHLEKLGARIFIGHSPENVNSSDVVVISSAVKETNPEVISAKSRNIPVIRRSEMLSELMRMKFGIAIAGTHGKTTTTSMIGQVLSEGNLDPTIVVGGRVVNLASHAKLGQGEYLVAEADEFDRSFLKLSPTIAVVTNLEEEHLDCYKNLDEIKIAFLEFMNKVPFYGTIVLCSDEASLNSLRPKIERPVVSYGLSSGAEFSASEISFSQTRSRCLVNYKNQILGELNLQVPGIHNVKNALAAIAVGLELNIDWKKIKKALEEFKGVNRRFEIKGEVNSILIVDDYAHHFTEIKATLKAARDGFQRRIVAVFQPHLYTRTRDFYKDFGQSFFDSDLLVVTDIYPAREEPLPGITGELVYKAAKDAGHLQAHYEADKEKLVDFVISLLKPNDLLITLGAGDIYQLGNKILNRLKSR